MGLPQWSVEMIEKAACGEDQLGVEGATQSYQHKNFIGYYLLYRSCPVLQFLYLVS